MCNKWWVLNWIPNKCCLLHRKLSKFSVIKPVKCLPLFVDAIAQFWKVFTGCLCSPGSPAPAQPIFSSVTWNCQQNSQGQVPLGLPETPLLLLVTSCWRSHLYWEKKRVKNNGVYECLREWRYKDKCYHEWEYYSQPSDSSLLYRKVFSESLPHSAPCQKFICANQIFSYSFCCKKKSPVVKTVCVCVFIFMYLRIKIRLCAFFVVYLEVKSCLLNPFWCIFLERNSELD